MFEPDAEAPVPPIETKLKYSHFVVQVFDTESNPITQELTPPDPNPQGLTHYHSAEKTAVKTALEDSNVVFLVGPSRSGKTESILLGKFYEHGQLFDLASDTALTTRPDTVYVDLQSYLSSDPNDILASIIDELDGLTDNGELDLGVVKNKTLILDEFSLQKHQAVIPYLKKMVLRWLPALEAGLAIRRKLI